MNVVSKGILMALLPFFVWVGAHKFYISVTNVDYAEKDNAVQIITRVFIDDMNAVLTERYGVETKLGTEKESELDREHLNTYLRSKFVVSVNGKVVKYTFIGKKYDTDMILCYIEVPDIPLADLKQIAIQNEILMDFYDDQQNVVHFKINGKKKSFVLIKSDTKGMLNL